MSPTHLKKTAIGQVEIPLHFHHEGLQINTGVWRYESASVLAGSDGIRSLGPDHQAAISFIQEKCFKSGELPSMSLICDGVNLSTGIGRIGSCLAARRSVSRRRYMI